MQNNILNYMSKLKNKIKILTRNNLPGLYSVMRSIKNKEHREHYKKMDEESIFTDFPIVIQFETQLL